jgi:hypothetical protein
MDLQKMSVFASGESCVLHQTHYSHVKRTSYASMQTPYSNCSSHNLIALQSWSIRIRQHPQEIIRSQEILPNQRRPSHLFIPPRLAPRHSKIPPSFPCPSLPIPIPILPCPFLPNQSNPLLPQIPPCFCRDPGCARPCELPLAEGKRRSLRAASCGDRAAVDRGDRRTEADWVGRDKLWRRRRADLVARNVWGRRGEDGIQVVVEVMGGAGFGVWETEWGIRLFCLSGSAEST